MKIVTFVAVHDIFHLENYRGSLIIDHKMVLINFL